MEMASDLLSQRAAGAQGEDREIAVRRSLMRMSEGASFKRAYRRGAENGIDRCSIFRQGRGQDLDDRPVAPLLDERVLREHRLSTAPRFIEQAAQTNGLTPVFGRAQTTSRLRKAQEAPRWLSPHRPAYSRVRLPQLGKRRFSWPPRSLPGTSRRTVRARPPRDPPTSIAPGPLSKPFGSASAKNPSARKDVSAAARSKPWSS